MPGYCDDPEHTPATAYRERQRRRAQETGHAMGEIERPVTQARFRAGAIRDELVTAIEAAQERFSSLVEELRTLGDPDAAAVEMDTVRADAEQRVAEARGQAAHAEAERQAAVVERDQHDLAAADLALQA